MNRTHFGKQSESTYKWSYNRTFTMPGPSSAWASDPRSSHAHPAGSLQRLNISQVIQLSQLSATARCSTILSATSGSTGSSQRVSPLRSSGKASLERQCSRDRRGYPKECAISWGKLHGKRWRDANEAK